MHPDRRARSVRSPGPYVPAAATARKLPVRNFDTRPLSNLSAQQIECLGFDAGGSSKFLTELRELPDVSPRWGADHETGHHVGDHASRPGQKQRLKGQQTPSVRSATKT